MLGPIRIESRDNQRLVNARKVRDGKVPGSIFVEGRRLVEEALHSGLVIEHCLATESTVDSDVVKECLGRNVEVILIHEKIFRSVADTDSPQDILVIAKRPGSDLRDLTSRLSEANVPVVVYLSHINNPSNLGAIVRTAEAAGATGVICSTGSADPFSPKALRGSMGSAFRLPILTGVANGTLLEFARDHDLVMTATSIEGTASYLQIDWTRPRIVLFGSEAAGLDVEMIDAAEDSVFIPIADSVESLNLAVSAGVILFEAKRQCALLGGRD